MNEILIAGIGNIFMGDDAFGLEVVAELGRRPSPEGVRVVDFGIRSYDLAFALTENYDAVVLVDATQRGEPAGTTYLIELSLDDLAAAPAPCANPHSLDPICVLQMAQSLGGVRAKLFLVGCEPAVLEIEDGQLGLSPPVRAAVPQAVRLIEEFVSDWQIGKTKTHRCVASA